MDGYEGGHAEALEELLPLSIAGGLRRHHDDVDVLRRDDEAIGDGEAVGEIQGGALL